MGRRVMTVAHISAPFFAENRFRVDVTHLSLYNLSVIHKKKYFDSEMHLMTYINDNWELLQLGEVRTKLKDWMLRQMSHSWILCLCFLISGCLCLQLTNTPRSERYKNVLEALNNNSNMWVIAFPFCFTVHWSQLLNWVRLSCITVLLFILPGLCQERR